MNEKIFHIGIKALILNKEGNILLLKANPAELRGNKQAHWDIPGGRIKHGDSPEQTLKNEILEELGVEEVEIENLFDASISNLKIPLETGEEVGLALFTYICNKLPENAEIKLSTEHTEYKWADIAEAKKLLAVKFNAKFIEKLDSLKTISSQ